MPDNAYMWQMFIANKIVTIDIIKRKKKNTKFVMSVIVLETGWPRIIPTHKALFCSLGIGLRHWSSGIMSWLSYRHAVWHYI